jgi:hypothetical protein
MDSGDRQPAQGKRCPWCSALVPDVADRCPSCQAGLVDSSGDSSIPGVTSVDPDVVASEAAARKRLAGASNPARSPMATLGSTIGGALGGPLGGAAVSALMGGAPKVPHRPQTDILAGAAATGAEAAGAEAGRPEPHPLADPWADLPPAPTGDQVSGTAFDPRAAGAGPRSGDAGPDEDGRSE